jgi:hypothetical protein
MFGRGLRVNHLRQPEQTLADDHKGVETDCRGEPTTIQAVIELTDSNVYF